MVNQTGTSGFWSNWMVLIVGMTLVSLAFPQLAYASPQKQLGGKIIVSTKRFPSRFDSDKAMVAHMKKVNTHEVAAEGDWEFEYMVFLKQPLGTLQASVSFYDVTHKGSAQLVDTFTFYPSNAKDSILASHQRLSSEKFSPDRKYRMEFSRGYGQKALASTTVVLRRK